MALEDEVRALREAVVNGFAALGEALTARVAVDGAAIGAALPKANGAANGHAQTETAASEPAKPRRGRPTKEEQAARRAAQADEGEDEGGEEGAADEGPALTLEDVATAAFKVRDKHGIKAAKQLVQGFGVAELKFIPKARWAEAVRLFNHEAAKPAATAAEQADAL